MNRKQFAVIAVFTAMETYFFNDAQSPDSLYGGEDC